MEYKKGYNIIQRLILGVLILLGVYFVFAGLDTSNTTAVTNSTVQANLSYGTGIHVSEAMIINISVVHDGAEENITNFTVDLPAGNYTFIGFANLSSGHLEEFGNENETTDVLSNVTYFGANPTAEDTISWDCINTSVTSITCNTTEDGGQPLGPDVNTTLKFAILVSAIQGIEEPSNVWNISANHSAGGVNSSTFNLMVDALVPRITELNITDGNTTLYNGTSLGDRFVLDNESDLTVYATVTDMLHSDVVLYYLNNNTDVANFSNQNYTNFAVMNRTEGNGDSRVYSATITSAHLIDQNITTFIIVANDTSNQRFVLNETSGVIGDTETNIENETGSARDLRSFAVSINSSVPHVRNINITDGVNTLTKPRGGSGDYLRGGTTNYTVRVEVNGHEDAVMLLWSYTNTTQLSISGDFLNVYTLGPGTNITYMTVANGAQTDQGYVVWNGSITDDVIINDTTVVTFSILVNATDLTSNSTTALNDSTYNKIIPIADGSDSFNFTVDDSLPAVSITAPSDTTIDVRHSITYSCSATDDLSGASGTYTWTLTKPGGTTATKTGSSVTFTDTDTSQAGTYTVDCSTDDDVGNTGSATSVSFNALYGTGGAAALGGSSGGGSRTVTVPAETEVDAGTVTSEGVNTLIGTGGTASFTVAGQSHSAKVISIGVDEVTIEISSPDPLTLTLKVGETKEVDIDEDGKNDLSVTLNRIVDGQADLTFTEITEVKELPEGIPPGVEELPEEAVEKPSRIGLIITIIVIIAVLVIGYFLIKKKK